MVISKNMLDDPFKISTRSSRVNKAILNEKDLYIAANILKMQVSSKSGLLF